MKEKEEDDLNVCDMDVDQSVEESITEISENDISQDSQVLFLNKYQNTSIFYTIFNSAVGFSYIVYSIFKYVKT